MVPFEQGQDPPPPLAPTPGPPPAFHTGWGEGSLFSFLRHQAPPTVASAQLWHSSPLHGAGDGSSFHTR